VLGGLPHHRGIRLKTPIGCRWSVLGCLEPIVTSS
jgi:hypothetical protein